MNRVGYNITLLTLLLWLLIVLAALFWIVGSFTTFHFVQKFGIQSQDYAEVLISSTLREFISIIIFALLNGIIIFFALRSTSFARKVLIISGIVFVMGLAANVIFAILLSSPFTMVFGVDSRLTLLFYSSLIQLPLLLLIKNGNNRQLVIFVSILFISITIIIAGSLHIYTRVSLLKKVQDVMSQPASITGFEVFKPTYFPGQKISLKESVDDIAYGKRYTISYDFTKDGIPATISIEETKYPDQVWMQQLKDVSDFGKSVKTISLNEKTALLDVSDLENTEARLLQYRVKIYWKENETNMNLIYFVNSGNYPTEMEIDAIKVVESMKPIQ